LVATSWGRLKGQETASIPIFWRHELPELIRRVDGPLLAHGLGRSYGDSCLIEQGQLLLMSPMQKLRWFDTDQGVISCEAGISFAELLDIVVPRGWFVPVTPGTKFVTLGGAIANDVHGKNHHKRGTIGRHIRELELLRSDGEARVCSPSQETELFRATIGGLGLTGVITWATLELIPIRSALIDMESIKTHDLEDFFSLEDDSAEQFEYTVSWIDCMAKGARRGRGLFLRGNHAKEGHPAPEYAAQSQWKVSVPCDAPGWLLNPWSIRIFNEIYYHKQRRRYVTSRTALDPFFYPLDMILHWNRLYGKRGLLQYQCVLPPDRKDELRQLFDVIAASGQGSFLAVIKKFGDLPSPGLLSFPREGYTLTLDFCQLGSRSQQLFRTLDRMVIEAGGRLYPAKDALMSAQTFQAGYPQWQELKRHIDPKFQSAFWKRVSSS
jgi:FAD/FMN-containing dehydrogenase